MVLHDTPPKPSHRVLAAEPRVFVSFSFCSLREKHLLKHLQLFGLFTLPFFTFLPTVAIELTENQCQSVYMSRTRHRILACVSRTRHARSPQRVAFSVAAVRPTLRL